VSESLSGLAARRASAAACVAAAALLAAGCSLNNMGRSAGQGLVQGLADKRDTLAIVGGPTVDSLTFRLTRALRDSLRPQILALLSEAGDTAERRADSLGLVLGRRLEGAVSGRLRDSVEALLGRATTGVRDSVRGALRLWLNDLLTRARTEGGAAVGALADSALQRGTLALAAGLRRGGPLRDSLLGMLRDLSDSASAGAEPIATTFSDKAKDLLKTVGGKVLAGAIVLTLIGAGVLWWLFRKRQKMLAVMTTAIEHLGTEQLKQNIQQQATAGNVEQDLHRYLKRRGMSG
jgi:hypothetical protein